MESLKAESSTGETMVRKIYKSSRKKTKTYEAERNVLYGRPIYPKERTRKYKRSGILASRDYGQKIGVKRQEYAPAKYGIGTLGKLKLYKERNNG